MKPTLALYIIAVILLVVAGCTQISPSTGGTGNPYQPGSTTPTGNTQGISSSEPRPIVAAYFLVLDDAYPAAISVSDRIPWKKVNRVYIAFATLEHGMLTDYPACSSPESTASREENGNKIRNIVALVHQANPDAEIFISSNFGGEVMGEQYLLAAQDPQKFADSVVAYLNDYGFDGYDMDWESSNIDNYAPPAEIAPRHYPHDIYLGREWSSRQAPPAHPHGLAGSRIRGDGGEPGGERGPA